MLGDRPAAEDGPAPDDPSAIVVVPDARAIESVLAAARAAGLTRWTARSGGDIAVIQAADSPSVRYGSFLAALRGEAPIVLGSRPAILTPVPRAAHLTIWDDGNSAYDEPHAPQPRLLTVAAMRSEAERCGLLVAGFAPSVAAWSLVHNGWASPIEGDKSSAREATPTVAVLARGDRDA